LGVTISFQRSHPGDQCGQQCGTLGELADRDVLVARVGAVTGPSQAVERGDSQGGGRLRRRTQGLVIVK
jgi:hypothetical protein